MNANSSQFHFAGQMPRPSAVCDFVIQQVNSECSSAMSTQNGQLACFPFQNHTQRMSTQPLSVRTGECTAAAGSVAQRSSFWLLAAIDGHAKNFAVFLLPGGLPPHAVVRRDVRLAPHRHGAPCAAVCGAGRGQLKVGDAEIQIKIGLFAHLH